MVGWWLHAQRSTGAIGGQQFTSLDDRRVDSRQTVNAWDVMILLLYARR